jgi:LPS sulfotransferase NodH
VKAVIVTSQRTGSTFLTQCLNSHPQVRCYGEILVNGLYKRKDVPRIFDQLRKTRQMWWYVTSSAWRPARLLDSFYARGEAPVMAFKAMYNHLADPRARHYFCHHTEIRVIHLRRDNLLKQHVSKVLAPKKFAQQPWGSTKPLPAISTRISPARAIKEMQRAQELFQKYERLFSRHPRIELVYETMIEGQSLSEEAAAAVTDLLELDPAPMSARAVKVNPDNLEPLVENYDELVRALRGTEFERFLD